MTYNWTLDIEIITTIADTEYTFSQKNNPYDLTEIIEEDWTKDAIARGYFQKVEKQPSKTEEITE